MTGFLTDYTGQRYKLPLFLSWEITHTDGTDGTDCFEVRCAYDGAMKEPLEKTVYFELEHEKETVFYGILDEYEVFFGKAGKTVTLTGRGMGARLIDNKCVPAEFGSCSLSQILANYVTPYGVTVDVCDAMPALYGYGVSTGQSAMGALTDFCRIAGGIMPRFSKDGRLMLTNIPGNRFKLNVGGAYDITLRERRYGVLSSVKVVTADGVQTVAENSLFKGKGISASGVVTVPRDTTWNMIRYTGAYQIEKSMEGRYALEITVPDLFPAFPGDICVLDEEFCRKGEYRVKETCCFGDSAGCGTRLCLVKEE